MRTQACAHTSTYKTCGFKNCSISHDKLCGVNQLARFIFKRVPRASVRRHPWPCQATSLCAHESGRALLCPWLCARVHAYVCIRVCMRVCLYACARVAPETLARQSAFPPSRTQKPRCLHSRHAAHSVMFGPRARERTRTSMRTYTRPHVHTPART